MRGRRDNKMPTDPGAGTIWCARKWRIELWPIWKLALKGGKRARMEEGGGRGGGSGRVTDQRSTWTSAVVSKVR